MKIELYNIFQIIKNSKALEKYKDINNISIVERKKNFELFIKKLSVNYYFSENTTSLKFYYNMGCLIVYTGNMREDFNNRMFEIINNIRLSILEKLNEDRII